MRNAWILVAALLLVGCSSSEPQRDGPATADAPAAEASSAEAGTAAAPEAPASRPTSKPVAEGTTVVLLRHAEKASDPGDGDPVLSERGAARAQALIDDYGDAALDVIYASQYKRTQQTVQPLAQARRLTVTVHPGGDIRGLVEKINAEHAGQTVVVCGHSNTVPKLAEALGAEPFREAEYGKLYVVERRGEAVELHVRPFGE